ncbi:PGAP1-like protein-domain-containing protein [Halteromyces radiatus]|uniref:PGAP1-like protein-domain-containing protein n=1 Tax=Halteromyces radiatus TaxID=101107 RepID=UPI00221F7CA4|nr:PGAP1-like protein-domain-containing protein [Halteromyces radiatus]KAI8085116.1 PGAP1-like protein-domain-containing protein [Halteromyces radiatus]
MTNFSDIDQQTDICSLLENTRQFNNNDNTTTLIATNDDKTTQNMYRRTSSTEGTTTNNNNISIPKKYQLSTSCVIVLLSIVLISLGALATMLDSFMFHQKDTNRCRESYMRPLYLKQDGFDSEMTRFAGKYALYLYREKGVDLSEQPTGIPVLFIPGHAGSYKQIRSIAAESSYYYYQNYARNIETWDQGMRNLDFFTVDFNEEFSALHGQSLLEQAEYLNDAIDYILKLYPLSRKWGPQQNKQLPDPTSVIILGHSMGGTVARTMFTLHNYQPGSINTVITLSTPHLLPPAPFDWKISKIYDDIHSFWKRGYEIRHDQRQQQQQQQQQHEQHTTISSVLDANDILKDVTLISIAGGNLDSMICSDSANVGTFLPSNHGFTVFSTAIPGVWTGADHISILSCNQLVKVVSKTLLNIVDARRGSQTKPFEERIKVMEKAFLSGLEDRRGDGSDLDLGEITFHDLKPNQSRFLLPGQRLILDQSDKDGQKGMVFLPVYEGADALAMLTSYPMDKQLGHFDLLLCNKLETHIKGTTRMGCRAVTDSIVVPVPASTSQNIDLSSGNTFMFASITFEEMQGYEFLSVVDRRGNGDFGSGGFLIVEPYDFDTNTRVIEKSMTDIALNGIQIDINPALFSTVRIPAIESSMLAFHMNINNPQCSSVHFSPLLRQSISSMHESKFYVNIADGQQQIDMSVHGRTAFSTASTPIRLHHTYRHQQHRHRDTPIEDNARGLDINIWMDPSCNQPIQLEMTVDWYGSFGRIGFRNGIMLPTFAFIVVMVVWVTQIRCYFSTGIYPHFGQGLVYCLRRTLPIISVILISACVYQGWTDEEAYELLDDTRLFGQWWKRYVPESFSYNKEIKSSMSVIWGDVLAGRTDPFFWWLPMFGLVMSIGVVCALWLITSLFIRICAHMVSLFIRYYPIACYRPKSTTKSIHQQKEQHHHHYSGMGDGGQLWFLPDIYDNDSDRQRMERRIITTLILFSLVATCIPYQFVFLVAFLVHIITCVRSLRKRWIAAPSQELDRNNRYHYLQSILLLFITLLPFNAPILMVWIRNLSVHWFVPFSSDHSVLAIAPFMIYIEMLTNQKLMLPRMLSRIWSWITYCLFYIVVLYAFMYGIKYTHSLYFLSNGLIGWLLLLHFWNSSYGQQLYLSFMDLIYHYSFSKKKS